MSQFFATTPNSGFRFFRAAFGLLMAGHGLRYLIQDRVAFYFIDPTVYFAWPGFGWVRPFPAWGMYAVFWGQVVAGLGLAWGYRPRVFAGILTVLLTYEFLLEQAWYQNHHYLMCLIGFLLTVIPSGDHGVMPRWGYGLIRFQIALVYVLAALVKLEPAWLSGTPMEIWLERRGPDPIFGSFLMQQPVPMLMAWAGLLIDLLVFPGVLWRPTRYFAFGVASLFHILNAYIFHIGVFPWMMIPATTLFFPPDWPRRLFRKRGSPSPVDPTPRSRGESGFPRWKRRLVAGYVVVQLLVPFRYLLYPGNVLWTEQGLCFSWRMMLRSKEGVATFLITEPKTQRTWYVDPEDELAPWQRDRMVIKPDLILQYAHRLADRYERECGAPVEVRALTQVRLNGSAWKPLVDPEVDLARVKRSLAPHPWITSAPASQR